VTHGCASDFEAHTNNSVARASNSVAHTSNLVAYASDFMAQARDLVTKCHKSLACASDFVMCL